MAMLTQAEIVGELADATGFPRGEIRHVMAALEDLVTAELQEANKVKIGQLVQLEVKIRPARKARMGRNPQTGEDVKIKAKPASAVVKARLLKKAKDACPSTAKAKKVLGF